MTTWLQAELIHRHFVVDRLTTRGMLWARSASCLVDMSLERVLPHESREYCEVVSELVTREDSSRDPASRHNTRALQRPPVNLLQ